MIFLCKIRLLYMYESIHINYKQLNQIQLQLKINIVKIIQDRYGMHQDELRVSTLSLVIQTYFQASYANYEDEEEKK